MASIITFFKLTEKYCNIKKRIKMLMYKMVLEIWKLELGILAKCLVKLRERGEYTGFWERQVIKTSHF